VLGSASRFRDAYPMPAPIHRHSDFWQDPRTTELGQYVIDKRPSVLHAAGTNPITAMQGQTTDEAPTQTLDANVLC
jgi:hypothetical protein